MLSFRQMRVEDISFGMQLKTQAGWNQVESDWARFLDLSDEGCFIAEHDGTPAGTVATFVFGSVGWIAMLLVDEAHRHHGIGTRLLEHAVAFLKQRDVKTVRLDATPLGRPIYERVGFEAEYDLFRFQGKVGDVGTVEGVTRPDENLDALCRLDRETTGTDRRRLLEALVRERPTSGGVFLNPAGPMCASRPSEVQPDGMPQSSERSSDTPTSETDTEAVLGYALIRPGSRATQIGPAAAIEPDGGQLILDAVTDQVKGKEVFVDVPVLNHAAINWAETRGLTRQRVLTRMYLGEPIEDRPDMLWASSGPEKG